MHYCIECDWSIDIDEQGTEHEHNQRVIAHHVETGHTIAARSATVRPGEWPDDRSTSRNEAAE